MFGWRAQDAIGRQILELALRGEAAVASAEAWADLRAGTPWNGELDVVCADGSVVPADVQAVPIVDGDGNVTGMAAVVFPLVESPRAALVRSESRLALALEAAGITTWEWDRDNRVIWDANHPAVLGCTFTDGVATFDDFIGLIHPDDREGVAEQARSATSTAAGVPFRLLPPDGKVRWVLTRGRVVHEGRMIGIIADVTSVQLAEQRLVRTFETMTDGFVTLSPDGIVRFANREACHLFDRPSDDLVGQCLWELVPAIVGSPVWEACQRAWRDGVAVEVTERTEPLGRWLEIRAFPNDDGLSVYFHDVTDRYEAETAAAIARARLEFLAEATLLLDSSEDLTTTLERVASLSVPLLGDTCIVDVWEADGRRAVGVAAVDDDVAARLAELRRRWPDAASRAVPARRVAGGGRTEVFETFPLSMWQDMAIDDDHLAALVGIGLVSGITIPVEARGTVIGAMSLGMLGERQHTPSDITLAEELGRRAGLAIENARQHAHRAAVNRSLQARLLPPILARVPGLEVAARYVAAGELDVGGDFYDLFQVDESDVWLAAIGDVSGKGAEAAAMTGLLRHTLRAVAPFGASPDALVAELNKALLRESGVEQFCTVVVAALTLVDDGVRIVLASGGHPLPLLLRTDGTVSTVGRPGGLVGAFPEAVCPLDEVVLGPGDALVLYTDGVTERRVGGRFLGEEGLAEVVAGAAGRRAGGIADVVAAAVAASPDEPATDDMALLVLRARPR